jgi:RNA polymerase sigma factor (sigma-70 family)
MNEQKAVAGCKAGDAKSQKFLFDAYSTGMLSVCLRYVKYQQDAEEMMLNGFYKFFKNIDRFEYNGPGSVGSWLKRTMINECLMFLRKETANMVDDSFAQELSVATDLPDTLSAMEILKLVTGLPAGYRTIFNLFVIEGYSHKEIALALNISEGTSKSQLNKARCMLQKMIKKEFSYER